MNRPPVDRLSAAIFARHFVSVLVPQIFVPGILSGSLKKLMNAALMDGLPLSQKQAILLDTDGTVTDLIRYFSGEDIHVSKLSQDVVTGDKPAELCLKEPAELLHRRILLTGRKHYLYAESYFVIDRMSEYLRQALLESDVPIGLLWQQEKLETFREILNKSRTREGGLIEYFPDIGESRFLTRSYRVYHNRQPLGLIMEKFPEVYFLD